MFRSHIVSLTAATLLIQGCSEPDQVEQFIADTEAPDLRQPETVAQAARHSDPVSIIIFSVLPVAGLFFAFEGEQPPACPRLFDASDRETGIVDWRIEGDCEWQDEEGRHRIEGSIVGRGDENGTEMEYRGYRQITVSAGACAGQESGHSVTGVVWLPSALFPSGQRGARGTSGRGARGNARGRGGAHETLRHPRLGRVDGSGRGVVSVRQDHARL